MKRSLQLRTKRLELRDEIAASSRRRRHTKGKSTQLHRLQLKLKTAERREAAAETKLQQAREALALRQQQDIAKQLVSDHTAELKTADDADKAPRKRSLCLRLSLSFTL